MSQKILIVEDQFIEANNLQMILERAGYAVCPIAASVPEALGIIAQEKPELVLLDIFLKGKQTGIDLAITLKERNIAFVYLSANSNKETLTAAKATQPYGFLVKPFREKDVLVMLEIAHYLHAERINTQKHPMPAPEGQVSKEYNFSGIIGRSPALQLVLTHLKMVAPSATSVLILGESGTGKERVAECIHELSPRKLKPMVKVNCAALPANLVESILFGHERGAFTGAVEKRIGKFEQAGGGTIFLDEIGELSLELQVKLLRVLQEKEIERIGGHHTIRVDTRIIAATNRNLEKEVAEGRFRMDLYYRLNVFPIQLPPLRERKDDIPVLADHFLDVYCRKIGKPLMVISEKVMEEMIRYDWPGNIRELEHSIERSILLSEGKKITQVHLPRRAQKEEPYDAKIKTIEENEREHIIRVLTLCNGKIFGKGGAAEMLGMHVSTLNARIKKLGIEKTKSFIQSNPG